MIDKYLWLGIIIIAAVTAALRLLPFLIFKNEKRTPKIIDKLGRTLPCAIMGMLVIYCLKDVQVTEMNSLLPTVIAVVLTGAFYLWKRNTLLSILAGTLCYMFLVQFILTF